MRLSTGNDSLNCTMRGSVSPVKRPPHSFFSGAGLLVLGISVAACDWTHQCLPCQHAQLQVLRGYSLRVACALLCYASAPGAGPQYRHLRSVAWQAYHVLCSLCTASGTAQLLQAPQICAARRLAVLATSRGDPVGLPSRQLNLGVRQAALHEWQRSGGTPLHCTELGMRSTL